MNVFRLSRARDDPALLASSFSLDTLVSLILNSHLANSEFRELSSIILTCSNACDIMFIDFRTPR